MIKYLMSLTAATLLCGMTGSKALADAYIGVAAGQAEIENVDDGSMKIFGGYRGGNFGFEAAYHDLGKQSETDPFLGTASIEVTGMEVSAAGFLAANPSFDFFGKIGLFLWDGDFSLTGFPTVQEDGNDLILGIGAQFKPARNVSIRGEYQITELGVRSVEADVDILSIGLAVHF